MADTTKPEKKNLSLGGISLGQGAAATVVVLFFVAGLPLFNSYLKATEARKSEQAKASQEIEERTTRTATVRKLVTDVTDLKETTGANTTWIQGQVRTATKRSSGHDNRDAQIKTLQNADTAKDATLTAIRDWIMKQDPDANIPPVIYQVVYPENFNGTASDDG